MEFVYLYIGASIVGLLFVAAFFIFDSWVQTHGSEALNKWWDDNWKNRSHQYDKIKIMYWPDGDWCYADNLEEFSWKSDDYATLLVPEDLLYEEIDTLVHLTISSLHSKRRNM